ncbi:hypothetical protein EYF80_000014 [Liparis tanakae]|uniref:Uncharacterized protein n=1 Tax=Liparis tanakae TaxID=230148 RepID=A0A4Z2JHM4_9TELE|nr:hypothetical protein EYF80_000014 [Liparis tanakae]
MLISAQAESPDGVQTLVVVQKKSCRNADWRSLGWRSLGWRSLGWRSLGWRSLGWRSLGAISSHRGQQCNCTKKTLRHLLGTKGQSTSR